MRESNIFFYPFLIALFVYFLRTAIFWFYSMNYGISTHDVIMYASLCAVEFIILLYVLFHLMSHKMQKGVHVICLLWFLFTLVTALYSRNNVQSMVKMIIWPMLFEATYLFIRDQTNRVVGMRYFYYAVAAIGIVCFASSLFQKSFGAQTNTVYFFVLTAPFLLLVRSKRWRIVVLVVMTLAATLSMKRSMLLSLALFWAMVSSIYLYRTGKIVEAVAVFLVFVGVGYFAYNYVDRLSSGFFSSRFEDEDMSNGRIRIYEYTWRMIISSEPDEWILGHGHNAVREDSPLEISAHNEWMEVLYDYGSFTFLLYCFFWVYVIRRWLFHLRCRSSYYLPYTFSVAIFIVMSMVSQLILYASYYLYLVMFWAAVEALTEREYYEYRRVRKMNKALQS